MASLEKQLKATLEGLSTRTSSIAQDVGTSLQVSEARAKHLDQLYRDMNAENEALYARFNEELEKVTSSARRGKADEEVQRRLKASEEEAARLRKENARLKREVAGLKAQIREWVGCLRMTYYTFFLPRIPRHWHGGSLLDANISWASICWNCIFTAFTNSMVGIRDFLMHVVISAGFVVFLFPIMVMVYFVDKQRNALHRGIASW
jgi:hypothetical protein